MAKIILFVTIGIIIALGLIQAFTPIPTLTWLGIALQTVGNILFFSVTHFYTTVPGIIIGVYVWKKLFPKHNPEDPNDPWTKMKEAEQAKKDAAARQAQETATHLAHASADSQRARDAVKKAKEGSTFSPIMSVRVRDKDANTSFEYNHSDMPHRRFDIYAGRIRTFFASIVALFVAGTALWIWITQVAFSQPLPDGTYVQQPEWLATSAYAIDQPVVSSPTIQVELPSTTPTASGQITEAFLLTVTGGEMWCNPSGPDAAVLFDANWNTIPYSKNCIVRGSNWGATRANHNGVDYIGFYTEQGLVYVQSLYNLQPYSPQK